MKIKEIYTEIHKNKNLEFQVKDNEVVRLLPNSKKKWITINVSRYIKTLIGIYVQHLDPRYFQCYGFWIEDVKRENPEDLICKLVFRSSSFTTLYVRLGEIEQILNNMNQKNLSRDVINEVMSHFYPSSNPDPDDIIW